MTGMTKAPLGIYLVNIFHSWSIEKVRSAVIIHRTLGLRSGTVNSSNAGVQGF